MSDVLREIEACIPALRRYASALLRNRQEVDDLVQDCLVRALDGLHSRRSDANLRAWLFSIMHNLFISHTRRIKVRGTAVSVDLLEQPPADHNPGQEVHMRGRDLLRALDALPEEQRGTLLLVAVEDFSYADISRVTGVPIGTVMSRLSRARDRLRRAIDEAPATSLRRVK